VAETTKRELAIIFFGSPDFAVPALRALRETRHRLLAVVTQPDRPAGRGRRLTAPPVKRELAEWPEPPPLLQPERVNAPEVIARLQSPPPDLFVSAAFGQIFRPALLEVPRIGSINLHASLLPKYRGAAPVQHALLNGERETGITVIWMDAGMDTGDMLLQRPVSIGTDDTAGDLSARLSEVAAEALLEALDLIASGQAPRTPQDDARATAAPMIRRADAEIDWSRPAAAIHHLVRAMNPWPGAFTHHHGKLLKVLRADEVAAPGSGAGRAGEIAEVEGDRGFLVRTGEGQLRVTGVQPESRAPMSATEYVRGYRAVVGDRLGRLGSGVG
jgi:methionyl-tRNA formyltransferase